MILGLPVEVRAERAPGRLVIAKADDDLFSEEDLGDDDLFGGEELDEDADLFGEDEASDEVGDEPVQGEDVDEVVTDETPPPDPEALEPVVTAPASDNLPSEGIEEILIQGQVSGVEDIGQSDSVVTFGAEDLKALGVQDVSDLSAVTPNLEIRVQGATSPTFFLRGVGLADFSANAPGAVAIYEDGVARNAPALQLGTVFDVTDIAVFRGPEGSGTARNASGGSIQIYTNRPSGELSGSLRSTYGNYNFTDFEGHVEAPILSEVLSARIAFRTIERDGYGENRCAGAPPLGSTVSHCGEAINFGTGNVSPVPPGLERDVNDRSRWAGRGSIRFQPTEYDMDWVFNVHGSQLDEYSRLGQAIGTAGTQTYPDGTQIGGILGGTAGTIQNYRDRDILDMRLNVRNKLLAQGLTGAALRNARDIVVMNELARDLDSDPYAGDYNRTGKTRLDTWGGYLSGEMTIGETTNFRTITAYDAYERYTNTDTDFTPNILFENASTDRTWQVYQDLKLDGEVSGLGGGSFLESLGRVFNDATTYSLGAYTLIERQDSNVNNFLDPQLAAAGAAFRKFDQENESFGAYAEFEWEFLDDFTLKGGFRYNWQRSRMEFELFRGGAERKDVGTQTWDHPTGTLRLTYQMTDEVQVYAKYNHGWKAGYFNATGSLFKGFTPTDPEKIDAYEVGLRGNFFDGQVDFETALFYYRYEDYQVFQVDQDFGSLPEVEVINASDAENYGAEISVTIEPADFLEGLSITARCAWLESQFLDFTDPQLVQLQTSEGLILANISQDYSGNRLINSPQFSFSISGHWTLDFGKYGSLIPRYDGNWTDDVAFDSTGGRGLENDEGQLFLPDNTLGQEAYWIHNARLAYRLAGSNIEIAGWVRNFTDQSAKVGGFNASAFQNVIINFVNEPRTYGMDVQISW